MKKTILTIAFALVCIGTYAQSDEDQDLLLARRAIKTKMHDKPETSGTIEQPVKAKTPPSLPNTAPVYASTGSSISQTSYKSVIAAPSQPLVLEEENRNKLKLAFYVDGQKVLTSRGIFKSDQNIALKAFTFATKQALVITEMSVDLVRNGKKINSTKMGSEGNIYALLDFAQPGDQLTLFVKEVYETTPEGHLRSYAKGNLYVNIPFVN
jgi:hypothetical protein